MFTTWFISSSSSLFQKHCTETNFYELILHSGWSGIISLPFLFYWWKISKRLLHTLESTYHSNWLPSNNREPKSWAFEGSSVSSTNSTCAQKWISGMDTKPYYGYYKLSAWMLPPTWGKISKTICLEISKLKSFACLSLRILSIRQASSGLRYYFGRFHTLFSWL